MTERFPKDMNVVLTKCVTELFIVLEHHGLIEHIVDGKINLKNTIKGLEQDLAAVYNQDAQAIDFDRVGITERVGRIIDRRL